MRTKKQILSTIASISTAAGKLQTRIHECAMECITHAHEHGDATLIQQLYLVLPAGQRREALIEWVHIFTPIRVRQKGEKVGIMRETSKNYTPWDLEGANESPYYAQDERNMFKLDQSKLDPDAFVKAAFISSLKKIDKAIAADEDETDPYKLDFDPEAATSLINAKAKAMGVSLSVN